MGWLIWNGMRVMAALGLTMLAISLVLLIWFMFDVGFAWLGFVAIGLALLLALLVLKAAYNRTRARVD